jgi:hypothetical protein
MLKMNVTIACIRNYENERLRAHAKNKANSNPISKGNPWLIPNTPVLQEMSIFVNFCRFLSIFVDFFTLFVEFLRTFVEFLQLFTPFSPCLFYPNSITPPPNPLFQLKNQPPSEKNPGNSLPYHKKFLKKYMS